jgi:hypothetical protein
MTLDEALRLITDVHTQDDPLIGFTISPGRGPYDQHRFTVAEYLEAWEVIRKHLGLQTRPSEATK